MKGATKKKERDTVAGNITVMVPDAGWKKRLRVLSGAHSCSMSQVLVDAFNEKWEREKEVKLDEF